MYKKLGLYFLLVSGIVCGTEKEKVIGSTLITKWQSDKKTAISITYDDGSINQFKVAKPIMDKYQMPGTFYILTGNVDGSKKGKFIGRPKEEIIKETENIKTNEDNFFERASLIAYTGTTKSVDYHSRVGALYEEGKIVEAYKLLDEGYRKLRNGELKKLDKVTHYDNSNENTTWDDFKAYTKEGHEIASHTITHPRLAVLDGKNLLYELEQSKKDIERFLGKEYTFSAECPYGTEDERVMEYAHKIYPSLRNRMPELFLEELNRWNNKSPGESKKEYVQWQRGALTNTEMNVMKGWVDTCLNHNKVWLVLVFHGVDGIGWESKTGAELEEYFKYINDQKEQVWIATFADVTKYIRERKNTVVESEVIGKQIKVNITTSLNTDVYNVPITLKTYIPESWKSISINYDKVINEIQTDELGNYVIYSVLTSESELLIQEK